MQPSAAALQLSPWKEPFVSPRLKEICAGLFPPPVLLTLHGTWRTFSYHLASGIFPKLLHNSCCRLSLKTGQIFFLFLHFYSSLFEVQIYERSFLDSIFTAGTKNCTISHSGVWPWTICKSKWAHLFIWMRKLLFLYWYCLCWWFELCLKTLSMFKEPCKWRFIIQLQSLSPVFFLFFFDKYVVFKLLLWDWGDGHTVLSVSPQGSVTFH